MQENTPKNAKRTVYDAKNTAYELVESLAEGGQGKVFKTNYKNVLVKVSKFPDSDPRTEAWNRQLEWVIHQNLAGLNIARPQILITKPRRGYVMELIDGLEPLQKMMNESCEKLWAGEGISGFISSGGVKRRLNILSKLARLMAQLHGRALAFGDLSPANIFISESVEHAEVWLIDCDNICAMSRYGSSKIYSPDFGAPEIMRGECGVNSLTDSWSFAVIAFQLLTLLHPLKGDLVENGPEELVDDALRGELPWIGHSTDQRNISTIGIPGSYVLTPKLFSLFEQCFDAGLNEPGERPTMAEWAEAFEAALAMCIECENNVECGSSFLFDLGLECPFCETPRNADSLLKLAHFVCAPYSEIGLQSGELKPDLEENNDVFLDTGYFEVITKQTIELRSSPVGTSTYFDSTPVCKLTLEDKGLHIETLNGSLIIFEKLKTKTRTSIKGKRLLSSKNRTGTETAVLHIGDLNKTHATWHFTW